MALGLEERQERLADLGAGLVGTAEAGEGRACVAVLGTTWPDALVFYQLV